MLRMAFQRASSTLSVSSARRLSEEKAWPVWQRKRVRALSLSWSSVPWQSGQVKMEGEPSLPIPTSSPRSSLAMLTSMFYSSGTS